MPDVQLIAGRVNGISFEHGSRAVLFHTKPTTWKNSYKSITVRFNNTGTGFMHQHLRKRANLQRRFVSAGDMSMPGVQSGVRRDLKSIGSKLKGGLSNVGDRFENAGKDLLDFSDEREKDSGEDRNATQSGFGIANKTFPTPGPAKATSTVTGNLHKQLLDKTIMPPDIPLAGAIV